MTNKSNDKFDIEKVWQTLALQELGWDLVQEDLPCPTWRSFYILLFKFDPFPINAWNPLCLLNVKEGALLLKFYKKFAKKNIAPAIYFVGTCHEYPIPSLRHSLTKAKKYYLEAANAGSVPAAFRLGLHAELDTSYAESMKWYLIVSNTLDGNPEADNSIGWFYEQGYGVTQDYKLALKFFLKADRAGNPKATTNIGWLYHNGWGVRQSWKKAMEYYLVGHERGNFVAATNIAWLYADGLGFPIDHNKAYYYYKVAADGGNSFGQNGVGWCYHLGYGVEKSLDFAEKYYKLAADQGDPRAPNNLAILQADKEREAKAEKKKKKDLKKSKYI